MKHWLTCLIVLFCAIQVDAAPTHGPAAVQATVCQLENHPNRYDRKLVQVRGRIYFGKFDFEVEANCQPHSQARVWLDLGGDIVSPSEYWGVASYLQKQKGVDVQVRGIAIPAVRNVAMDRFVNEVGATRFRKPNGDGCGSECLLYEVSAALTGRFFAGTGAGGFGLEQCCHLLVIQRVSAISSRRTSVPAGGQYECTSDKWQLTPEEMKRLSAIEACSLRAKFQGCYVDLAKHWGDSIKPLDALEYEGPWTSRDMTRYYRFSGNFVSKRVGQDARGIPFWSSEITPPASVTRQVCHATVPPQPASDDVSCRFYRSGEVENPQTAIALQTLLDSGHDVWRASDMAKVGWLAVEKAQREWNAMAASEIKLEKCEAYSPSKDDDEGGAQQWGYCTWVAKNDMEDITVRMHKSGSLRKRGGNLEKVTWIATDVELNVCDTAAAHH